MTVNGIEVDETREDESRDYLAEAGRIARGEVRPDEFETLAQSPTVYISALVDEVGGALLELSDWMREHTGPADGTVEILTRAREVLARLEPSK